MKIPFRVQSHVLKLLGDELIGHDRLAVFELVKNSYDADATSVNVKLDLSSKPSRITVEDNGQGMSLEVIERGWLEIGSDFKRGEKNRLRTTKFGRMPLGEKGVGRLAMQKLGGVLKLVTKEKDGPEYELTINWYELINRQKYISDDLTVEVSQKEKSSRFKDGSGTLVEISELHRSEWSKKEVRDLYRLVSSLSNPFDKVESFAVNLEVPERETEISDLPNVKDMLDTAVWRFEFVLDDKGALTWEYEFKPPKFKQLEERKSKGEGKLELVAADPDEEGVGTKKRDDKIFLTSAELEGIGPISGRIYAFYRRSEILKESGSLSQIKAWLDSQTGVRVYRDRVRVFNYGEPGDDWLGLNARRINRPAGKLGTHSVIGHVELDLSKSTPLKEKTNREGFDENIVFRRLKRITLSIFDKLEREHSADREKIDRALKGDESTPGIQLAIESLHTLAKHHHIEKEVEPIVKSIQQELDTFRDLMISSGMAGMNLALVFHEVVHVIDSIGRHLDAHVDLEVIRREVEHLRKLLDTFRPLLQRERVRKLTAKELVERAANIHQDRFKRHQIVFSNWAADPEKGRNFPVDGPLNLLVGALSNVIDNAIYWVRYRKERDATKLPPAILIIDSWSREQGGIVAVIDNGPGFQLPAEQLGLPFRSTRAGGMGLGLYYCKLVLESLGGGLEVTDAMTLRDEIDISDAYDGAAVVFRFKSEK